MASAEQERLNKQAQALTTVQDEFSRLNAQFDGMLKESGLSMAELQASLQEKPAPELARLLDQAKAEATRAGAARAAQFAPAASETGKSAGRGRPGAMRV
ncbi:MAG: hypothetical protein LBV80_02780 [Deltaproteobacteria bacterium]|jgi:ElaB/YqjD/DUF883 family membrane-anchored ribosome-binding protein|nr:hypothetical protein [Deltaproteobacteria bacterium]